ncbi:hypothetical protein GRX03_03985 [Halovenus sp. WSH3]|uniref:Uncharacterized protein n=1 Tax=Halovenus carboxidivorans TaxID=2692199 RepID=A0A6B0T3J8_9EURY|nr:hypothetical protein [Halovenus carboxidivorans]MXR50766.1 hypothetical protein [Halovenus carboxidivorans]
MDQSPVVCPGCAGELSETEIRRTPQFIADTYFCGRCGQQFADPDADGEVRPRRRALRL